VHCSTRAAGTGPNRKRDLQRVEPGDGSNEPRACALDRGPCARARRPRAPTHVRSTQAEPRAKRPSKCARTAAAVGFYGIGPFGFEPQVLCMMMSSSGDAGTRGVRGVVDARYRGGCFRKGQ
jgi:hypothetical protein